MSRTPERRVRCEASSDRRGYAFSGPGFHVWDTSCREAESWAALLASVARFDGEHASRGLGEDGSQP